MSASGDVIKQVRLDRLDEFKRALPEQIALALALAKDDVTHFALTMSDIPYDTGRMQRSFEIASLPSGLVMKWDPADRKTGFHYALLQDLTHKTYAGFGDRVKEFARQAAIRRLREVLAAL